MGIYFRLGETLFHLERFQKHPSQVAMELFLSVITFRICRETRKAALCNGDRNEGDPVFSK